MSTTTSFLAPNSFSPHQWSSQGKTHEIARRTFIMKAQHQDLEVEEAPSPPPAHEKKAASPVESLPRQPMAKSKNMSQEYGGQFLSCTTRHVRIYAAYIDPITHAFDQTQMDKLTLILDPTDEFVWTPHTCQMVYAYFQELVHHYEEVRFRRSDAPAANMFLKPVLILLRLLRSIFHQIGLNPTFETAPTDNHEELLFSADPSPAVKAAAASIKIQLPVVDYISFAGGGREPPPPACAVCLQFMEARDQVRELGNCRHAFHVSCLDRWLDLGRFSCPLCRSPLLPAMAGGRKTPLRLLKLLIAGEASSLVRSC